MTPGTRRAAGDARWEAAPAVAFALLFAVAMVASAHPVLAYEPHQGDNFSYAETIAVNDGQGSYAGYSDQTQVTGTERVNSVTGANVSSFYKYTLQYSNNQGNSTSAASDGNFTWSSSSLTYLNGTDDQAGYSKPIYVWFAVNSSIPVGGTFYSLNTQLTVLSKNYSFELPAGGRYVQTIEARGAGQYQRNDSYGVFAASYTWSEYFDPSTGYIVGYHYAEQDNGKYQGQVGSFAYTDDLYATSTSYPLASGSPPGGTSSETSTSASASDLTLGFIVIFGLVIAVAIIGYAVGVRRGRGKELPKHSPYKPPPPPPGPWESKVDMGSTPPQQVVIRDVAKVNCRYCGTLIPSTADTCPYCGGPRK